MKHVVMVVMIVAVVLAGCSNVSGGGDGDHNQIDDGAQVIADPGWHYLEYQEAGDAIVIRIEVVHDTTDQRDGTWPDCDFFSMIVDVNQNGDIDANVDTSYGVTAGTTDTICTQYLISSTSSTCCGDFQSEAQLTSDFASSDRSPTAHVMWELTVPKDELSDNNRAHVVIKVYEPDYQYTTYPDGNEFRTSGTSSFNAVVVLTW